VAVSSQEVYGRPLDIQRKHSKPLNSIQGQECSELVRQLAGPAQVDPITIRILNPTDGNHPRPFVAGLAQDIQKRFARLGRNPPDFHSAICQSKPRVLIGGEFVSGHYYVIPRSPIKP
jgi:gentisate 1,2-dioxygenase